MEDKEEEMGVVGRWVRRRKKKKPLKSSVFGCRLVLCIFCALSDVSISYWGLQKWPFADRLNRRFSHLGKRVKLFNLNITHLNK
jgi:hypothetical protein